MVKVMIRRAAQTEVGVERAKRPEEEEENRGYTKSEADLRVLNGIEVEANPCVDQAHGFTEKRAIEDGPSRPHIPSSHNER